MQRIPLKSGDEYDCLTSWRRNRKLKKGELKKVKRRYAKRFRRWWKREILMQTNETREDV